jgi:hypothetical protein
MIGALFCSIGKGMGGCQFKSFNVVDNVVKLTPVGTITVDEVSSKLLDKLEEMGDSAADLNLADSTSRLYKKDDVASYLKLVEVDKIVYTPEDMDCDNYAGILYGKFCEQDAFPGGIIDSHQHRLNWFIDESGVLWFIEPQSRKMSRTLETWQGWDIKFFLS